MNDTEWDLVTASARLHDLALRGLAADMNEIRRLTAWINQLADDAESQTGQVISFPHGR